MKALVFGGAGFIGSYVVEHLVKRGYDVTVFEHKYADLTNLKGFHPIKIELGDFQNVADYESLLLDDQIVFHFISTTVPTNSQLNPVYDCESNLLSTIRLLDRMKEKQNARLLFLSSGGTVYGIPHDNPITEEHPTNPISSYGLIKRSIESYLYLYHHTHGLEYRIIRLSNPYGERQLMKHNQGVIRYWLERAKNNSPIEIWGDGEVIRDYVYIRDAAEGIIRVSELEPKEPHRCWNLGSGMGVTLNQLVVEIEQVIGKQIEPVYLEGRKFDVPVNVLDISRIKQDTNWMPAVSLREGIERTWHWINE